MDNPFVYWRPVQGDEFWGREEELKVLGRRLQRRESTVIVGEPHIGKTSFLLRFKEPDVFEKYIGEDNWVISWLNLTALDTPEQFWAEILTPLLTRYADDQPLIHLCEHAESSGYTYTSLMCLFTHLEDTQRHIVMILDEVESLLSYSNFQVPSFWGLLKVLTTHTQSLVMICASRLDVSDLNAKIRSFTNFGGSEFNYLTELRLNPLEEDLVEKTLRKWRAEKDTLLINDCMKNNILKFSGCHPFFVQAMAAIFLETKSTHKEKRLRAVDRFYHQYAVRYFDELWHTLSEREQLALLFLCLAELDWTAGDEGYLSEKIPKMLKKFTVELHHLKQMNLVNYKDEISENAEVPKAIEKKGWELKTPLLVNWMYDTVIVDSLDTSDPKTWLKENKLEGFLTVKEWEILKRDIKSIANQFTYIGTILKFVGSLIA